MLTIREIRALGQSLTAERFAHELGPFALIQRPISMPLVEATQQMGVPKNARVTQIARRDPHAADVLSLLFQFEDLIVATLPPVDGGEALTVGRAPDCELVLDEGSVSKRHAKLQWDAAKGVCTLEDLGSTNGTHLNGSTRIRNVVTLKDGDLIAFGEVVFWYLLTPSLFARLEKTASKTRTKPKKSRSA